MFNVQVISVSETSSNKKRFFISKKHMLIDYESSFQKCRPTTTIITIIRLVIIGFICSNTKLNDCKIKIIIKELNEFMDEFLIRIVQHPIGLISATFIAVIQMVRLFWECIRIGSRNVWTVARTLYSSTLLRGTIYQCHDQCKNRH